MRQNYLEFCQTSHIPRTDHYNRYFIITRFDFFWFHWKPLIRKLLLTETWHQSHRIDNLSLILATHPSYFDYWRKVSFSLDFKAKLWFQFHGALIFSENENDGLLRIEKIYIAIMAASGNRWNLIGWSKSAFILSFTFWPSEKASNSTYLYYLLINEFKADWEYISKQEKYAPWIEEGHDKIPQVRHFSGSWRISGNRLLSANRLIPMIFG